MKKEKVRHLVIGCMMGLLALILSKTYRPFIYQNNIYDYHLADTIGSLFCVPSTSMVLYSFDKNNNYLYALILSFVVSVLFEIFSYPPHTGVYDRYDLTALIIGTLIAFTIYKLRKNRNRRLRTSCSSHQK